MGVAGGVRLIERDAWWNAGRRRAPEAGGSRKRIVLWRAPRPKRGRVATSVRVAWPRPLAPPGAPSPFFRGDTFLKRATCLGRSRAARTVACIRPRASGGGGPREAWWRGASDSTLRFRCRYFVQARAPSTALRAVPLPRYRGAGVKCVGCLTERERV